ncbi:uncharacterized protein METZ01_LOCUS84867 [marine metagenome]|uniref:Uncharacterized protein n=1 Tax=marine metagenome TaxID=408172 RepID=A0A381UYG3_9ZZZZ
MYKKLIIERLQVSIASNMFSTIASPPKLNDVLNIMGTPVFS